MVTLIFIIQCSIGAVAFIHRAQVSRPPNIRRADKLNKKLYLTNLNPLQRTTHILQKGY